MHWSFHTLTTALWYGIPAAPASAEVLSECKTLACELALMHIKCPPQKTSLDGPLSTTGTTSECYVRSIDVCSNKLPVIYQESLLRTHVATYSSTRAANKLHLP